MQNTTSDDDSKSIAPLLPKVERQHLHDTVVDHLRREATKIAED